jgi:exosortase A-associated hydrolase 1
VSATEEVPFTFHCGGAALVAILHRPPRPRDRGVVVVVGAPQYRAGSHRQFVLLARDLAAAGFPVLRFDYRGMGDSDGEFGGFENVEADIRAAIDTLCARVPAVKEAVLWGLCDGAAAISFYAPSDDRVTGIVLLNPWVRSEISVARTRIRHYYLRQLLSPRFWRRFLGLRFGFAASLRSLVATIRAAGPATEPPPSPSLPQRVGDALRCYRGRVLVVLSGNDLTAQEFDESVLKVKPMAAWLGRPEVELMRLARANHTYSTRAWREQVHRRTSEWLARPRP